MAHNDGTSTSQQLTEENGLYTENVSQPATEKIVAAQDPEQPSQPYESNVAEPPDGGYGWVCVACCFFINAHTWGINSVRYL